MKTALQAPAEPKVLVYDGECPFCTGIARLAVRSGVLPPSGLLAFQDAQGPLAERLLAAGIRNEVLVLAPATGELRAGAPGLLWLLEGTRLAPLARRFARRPLLAPFDTLYGFIASNRRLFATPRPRGPVCACEPDDRPARQWAFAALATLLAAAPLLLLGLAAPRTGRLSTLAPLAAAGAPWLLPALLALRLPRAARRRYLAHLTATAAAGGLVLLPLALAVFVLPSALRPALPFLLALFLTLAGGLMFAMQRRRVAYQGLGRGRLVLWAACAGLGLAALLVWFGRVNP